MTPILGSLEFDDHQAPIRINSEEIDTSAAILPLGKLLGNNECIRGDGFNPIPQNPLQIVTLVDSKLSKGFALNFAHAIFLESIESHNFVGVR